MTIVLLVISTSCSVVNRHIDYTITTQGGDIGVITIKRLLVV